MTGIEFNDVYPIGLQQAKPDNFNNGCASSSGRGATSLAISNVSLSQGSSCTVELDLIAVAMMQTTWTLLILYRLD